MTWSEIAVKILPWVVTLCLAILSITIANMVQTTTLMQCLVPSWGLEGVVLFIFVGSASEKPKDGEFLSAAGSVAWATHLVAFAVFSYLFVILILQWSTLLVAGITSLLLLLIIPTGFYLGTREGAKDASTSKRT